MIDEQISALATMIIDLQAITEAQGELISRLFALVAQSSTVPLDVVKAQRQNEERVAYAAAVLPKDEASIRLLTLMAKKADAKTAIFELAERMCGQANGTS